VTAQQGPTDRDVIPRWRSVRRTIEVGEFQTLAVALPLSDRHKVELAEFESLWTTERTQVAASEFVGSSLIAGEPERAVEAAQMLEREGENAFLRRLGERAVQPSVTIGFANVAEEGLAFRKSDLLYRRVALQKARVDADPRNAIAWADLARWYTALGRLSQAEKALRVARSLAPTSRYLLRSASRFYVHIGEPESAYALLRASPRTFEDPWLMAAYLAVASTGQLTVSSLRPARRILEEGNFRPIEMAELESEVATLEMRSGRDRPLSVRLT
jgi:tetratricopeptide (TPR) repeat protein